MAVTVTLLTADESRPGAQTTVQIVATVVDSRGQPATDLAQSDFVLTVDGTPVHASLVTGASRALNLCLLLDHSGSLAGYQRLGTRFVYRFMPSLRHDVIYRGLVPSLREGDTVRLGSISDKLVIVGPLEPTRQALERADDGLFNQVRNSSPIWDAVVAGAMAMAPEPGRRGILLVTDGRANANHYTVEQAASVAIESGVQVFAVDVGWLERVGHSGAVAEIRADIPLRRLAEATGGAYFADAGITAGRSDLLAPARWITAAIRLLRESYTLSFDVPTLTVGQVSVTVKRPGMTVRVPSRPRRAPGNGSF